MHAKNLSSLESLSLACHLTGLLNTFLGLVTSFLLLLRGDIRHVPFGIYIFITGYAMVKISQKISGIIIAESSH